MADLSAEIQAYQRMQQTLEAQHNGRWVLIHDGELIGTYETFDLAADDAISRFGAGPFLIRQVGAQPTALPISVMYAWPHANR